MSKKYFILCIGSVRNTAINVVSNLDFKGARLATKEENKELVAKAGHVMPQYLRNGIEDGSAIVTVFDKRADARAAAKELNAVGTFEFRITEVGDKTARYIRPVVGWWIVCTARNGEEYGSAFNQTDDADAYIKHPTIPDEYILKTRARARQIMRENRLDREENPSYRVEPVYA